MAFELFGFKIGKIEDEVKQAIAIPSFAPKPNEDGAVEIAPGGSYGTYIDLESTVKNEVQLVTRYRQMAQQPDIDLAITDIINEAIINDKNSLPVSINLDKLKQPQRVKTKITEEFEKILTLLDFQNMAHDIFQRWYVDGRIYYHMMIDHTKPREGIKELRYIDPRRMQKVRIPISDRNKPASPSTQLPTAAVFQEYYLYNKGGIVNTGTVSQGVRISADSICHVHSGLLDERNHMVFSHLHKAIKPYNQLRMLEDATVVYRLARAPERRIFYIDVGNLPKMKAEQYLRDMMVKHKNRLVYDATTGEVRDDRKFMTMLEDYWLPRREGNRGTEITTLPGGQNLGQLDDVEYFRKKLYQSLNVPISRMLSESTFNMGRSSEISRDEIKFTKLIARLRSRFSHMFDIILETQLVLTGVMSKAEWKEIKDFIFYDFLEDNYYSELKEQEIMTQRFNILQVAEGFNGKYFSQEWIRKNILRFSDDEIDKINNQMSSEQEAAAAAQPEQPANDQPKPLREPTGEQPPQSPQPPASQPPQQAKPIPKPAAKEEFDEKPMTKEELELIENMSKLIENLNNENEDDLQDDK